MKRYWASVCTIPERCDRTIWIVLGTSISQSTPAGADSGVTKVRTLVFYPFTFSVMGLWLFTFFSNDVY